MKVDVLEVLPRWERYMAFFRLTVLRYLVVWFSMVPVLSGILSGLPSPTPVEIGGLIYTFDFSLPFSWQLLWLSSFSYFLALVGYVLRCPRFVSDYNSFSIYQARGHDPRWLARETYRLLRVKPDLEKLVGRLSEKGFIKKVASNSTSDWNGEPVVTKESTQLYFNHGEDYWVLECSSELSEANVRGLFWEIFARYSASRTFSRFTILVLLLISGALFTVVLVQHLWVGLHAVSL